MLPIKALTLCHQSTNLVEVEIASNITLPLLRSPLVQMTAVLLRQIIAIPLKRCGIASAFGNTAAPPSQPHFAHLMPGTRR